MVRLMRQLAPVRCGKLTGGRFLLKASKSLCLNQWLVP